MLRRISRDDRVGGHIFGDHGPGADHGVFSDRYTAQNSRVTADRRAFFNERLKQFPVFFGLLRTVRISGARQQIVGEHYAVAYKTIIFDMHSFADKGVAGNLAVLAYNRAFLDLDESAYFAVIVYTAAVSVYKIEYTHIPARFNVHKGFSGFIYVQYFHIRQSSLSK